MSHGLKKGFIGMMWMACVAVISACSPSPAAEPAALPPEGQVRGLSEDLLESGEAPLMDRIPMIMGFRRENGT